MSFPPVIKEIAPAAKNSLAASARPRVILDAPLGQGLLGRPSRRARRGHGRACNTNANNNSNNNNKHIYD